MLLQSLRAYSERMPTQPTLYARSPVRYIIEVDQAGRLTGLVDTANPSDPRKRRGEPRLVPQVQRSSGTLPLLLADKADYVLGYAPPQAPPRQLERAAARHRAFSELLGRCKSETEEPTVQAVQTFLQNSPLKALELGEDFDAGSTMTFRVAGTFPVDLKPVQDFWRAEHDPALRDAPIMQCVVCGATKPVLKRLQAKLKGVPGGQPSGTSIISANSEAFESYGLSASLIAPTCADCGERFTRAANELLVGNARQSSRFDVGGAAFIWWTKEEVGFDIRAPLTTPDPQAVHVLFEWMWSAGPDPIVDAERFYAVSLSGSGGRAVVRDWINITVGEVKRYLGEWFLAQRIVSPDGGEPRYFGLTPLALATVREAAHLPKSTQRSLLRAALMGSRLPPALLAQTLGRLRAERRMTHARAALIKLTLVGQADQKEDWMVQLNPEHPSPAYHCGRLFAVLEDVQREAIPRLNTTIADRFFGSASTAPDSVFSRLIRGAQPHFGKIERDKPAAYVALRRRTEEIMDHIRPSGFPRMLVLHDQGLFALGYYHQHAHDHAQAREASQRRRRGDAPANNSTEPDPQGDD